jgi:tryptophanyl-tRNA synthetase
MKRFLSGVQPSGLLHLGNYFGAIKQHIEQQDEGHCRIFIADFHALTTVQDRGVLKGWVREVALTYLSLGLDPGRTVFWRQSDVPEVTEIAWLLATVTGVGLLERGHSYKDKIARGLPASAGLLYYPVLMSADILSYDTDLVPVGKDQVQHVEFAQDMGGSFNHVYGDVFKRPEWRLSSTPRVLGFDGEKMSKSYGNHLWIFEEGKALKKAVNRIATDSRPPDEPKDLEGTTLFDWLKLFLTESDCKDLRARAMKGGETAPGYGELKQMVCSSMDALFGSARAERRRLLDHPEHVDQVLATGADRARVLARDVRDRAFQACGLR